MCNFKSAKKHYLHLQKWQKSNFCTRKKFKITKNAIFGLFCGAKIDFFWPFLKMQIMCFCTFGIALFSNFRELWNNDVFIIVFSLFLCLFFFQCIVCESNKATMQTFPCTHQVVCRTCFVRTIQTTVANRKLPLR